MQITISNYRASANYSRTAGQKTPEQLAASLTAKLNNASSPVTATVVKSKITVTSKFKGSISNYPLTTLVMNSSQFAKPSFSVVASGATLAGGTGGPYHRHFGTADLQQHQFVLVGKRSRR
jgi:phage tail sheath gpL-like